MAEPRGVGLVHGARRAAERTERLDLVEVLCAASVASPYGLYERRRRLPQAQRWKDHSPEHRRAAEDHDQSGSGVSPVPLHERLLHTLLLSLHREGGAAPAATVVPGGCAGCC